MDTNARTSIKRMVTTFVPGITPPVIDFTINKVWLASITTSSRIPKRRIHASEKAVGSKELFTLKRMDSGEWGERDLAHPIERKYKGRESFENPKGWSFQMD